MNAVGPKFDGSSFLAKILDGLLVGYQWFLSPWLGGCCRFEPSCSVYGREALARHPLPMACSLMLGRLLRCRPGGGYGFDPVPPKKSPLGSQRCSDHD